MKHTFSDLASKVTSDLTHMSEEEFQMAIP